jgi:hypothetical protein
LLLKGIVCMTRALFVSVVLAAGLSAPAAFGKSLAYDFSTPPGTSECVAPNSTLGGTVRSCDEVEEIENPTGGPSVKVSAYSYRRDNQGLPYVTGLNIDENGIGIGPDTPTSPMLGTPGASRVFRSTNPLATDGDWEIIRLEWDVPVSLEQLTIRSSAETTVTQSIQILGTGLGGGPGNSLLTEEIPFATGVTNVPGQPTIHNITFETPLVGSTFYVRPSVGTDIFAGYWLTGVRATAVPVPPALPLLGGAIALLAWRARSARRPAPGA